MILGALLLLTPARVPRFDPIELVGRYRAYRLPEPALNAKPVLCTDESGVQFVGFAIPGKPHILYRPWVACDLDENQGERQIGPLAESRIRDVNFDETVWPTIAILESRGASAEADRLLRAVFLDPRFDDPAELSPWRPMRERAWAYWRARAIEHPPQRAGLSKWLRSWSKVDGLQPSPAERSFLKDLDASLGPAPVHPHPNRFDRLMEQVLTARGEALSDQKYGPWSGYGIEDGDDASDSAGAIAKPVRELWEAGFDAVPTMFRYLDDRRITLLGGDEAFGTVWAALWSGARSVRYHRVCDVAADVILTALDEGPDFYSTRPREWDDSADSTDTPDQQIAAAKKMWPKWLAMKKIGERKVLLGRMAELDQEEKGALDTVGTDGLRAYPLRVLALKYRSDLVKFYRHAKFEHEKEQILDVLASIKSVEKPQRRSRRRQK